MLELTITLPDAGADVASAAHWSIRDGGDLVAGDQAAGPAPALAAVGAALLALAELERPGSNLAGQAVGLVERFDGGRLRPDDAALVLARALESDGAALVAAALVAAGAWPPPVQSDWLTDALNDLRAQQRKGGQDA